MKRETLTEINDVLKNEIVDRHSFYQLKYFIVNKEPTHQSKMWRCLRELKSRRDAMESIQLEMAEARDSRRLLDINLEKTKKQNLGVTELDIEELKIKERQIERQKIALAKTTIDLEKRLRENEQEASFFLSVFKELESHEPLKAYDSIEAQEEYWNERLAEEVRLKMLLNRPLDVELVKTVLAMGNNAPIKKEMVNVIGQLQERIAKAQQQPTKADELDTLAKNAVEAEEVTIDGSYQQEKENAR